MNNSGDNNHLSSGEQPQPMEAEVATSSLPSAAQSATPIGSISQREDGHAEQLDDHAYNDMENANNNSNRSPSGSTHHDDDINAPAPAAHQTAAAYSDMDRAIKRISNRQSAIKPPLPPARISGTYEEMMDALEGDKAKFNLKTKSHDEGTSEGDNPTSSPAENVQSLADLTMAALVDEESGTPQSERLPQTHTLQHHNGVIMRPTPRSMLPRQNTVEAPPVPILEASLVPDVPYYEATLVADVIRQDEYSPPQPNDDDRPTHADNQIPWRRKYQRTILVVLLVLGFGAVMTVVGAKLGSSQSNKLNDFNASENEGTNGADSEIPEGGLQSTAPNTKPSPEPSQEPSQSQNTSSASDILQSTAPSMKFSVLPSKSPTVTSRTSESPQSTAPTTAPTVTPQASESPQSATPTTTAFEPTQHPETVLTTPPTNPPRNDEITLSTIAATEAPFSFAPTTNFPVIEPILSPSSNSPTTLPSGHPSPPPSKGSSPSKKPTLLPTKDPTDSPSTKRPTATPVTHSPSRSPLLSPSASPTKEPATGRPTNRLTDPTPSTDGQQLPPPPSGNDSGGCIFPGRCCRSVVNGPPDGFDTPAQFCQSLNCSMEECSTLNSDGGGGGSPPSGGGGGGGDRPNGGGGGQGCGALGQCCRSLADVPPPPEYDSPEQFCKALGCDIKKCADLNLFL